MRLIAKKPCSFGGKKFYIGDEIPAKFVKDPAEQEKLGALVQIKDAQEAQAPVAAGQTITVNVHADEGDMPLDLTADGLQAIFDVLTATVPEAEPIIEGMSDSDALILLHVVDDRKTVKEAAKARAKALIEGQESEGEQ